MLGKLQPAFFPPIFGPDQDQPLDADAVRQKFDALAEKVGDGRSPEDIAEGFLTIAVENMANAIKKISVQRGYDVTRYAAQLLRRRRRPARLPGGRCARHETVLIHPFSGLLSAYGMGLASIYASASRP
jgi:5-oxoprolinase (ATP-hydrolysing)